MRNASEVELARFESLRRLAILIPLEKVNSSISSGVWFFAKQAQQNFVDRFAKNQTPDEMDEFTFSRGIRIANLLKDSNLASSTSEAFRMIKQGAAKIDGEKITNKDLEPQAGTAVYQVGKRKFARVTIN
jgi:tyrosyl-tRNA synthetase